MDVIAADKSKLSMEGLLKLEEKMSRVERGLERDTRELKGKLNGLDKGGDVSARQQSCRQSPQIDADTLARLRHQLRRLDEMQEDIEKSHERIKDKVERQIPEDLDELAQKLENSRRQLHERIGGGLVARGLCLDREENERYLAIREMQEEISKLRRGGLPSTGPGGGPNNVRIA